MIYLYIFLMAITTYLIRMLPLTIFSKKINNRFVQSFLYYVPYSCLTAMTIPAIFTSTRSLVSAACGFVVAVIVALKSKSLTIVALCCALAVFVVEYIIFR